MSNRGSLAQPWSGLVTGLFVLLVAGLIWNGCVVWAGMDRVDYMVRILISEIFGNFILLNLFQVPLWKKLSQPVKGMSLIFCSGILAVVTYALYRHVALSLVDQMPAGAPEYSLDLWIASAMLAVTFPVIVAYADGFGFWPFAAAAIPAAEDVRDRA